MRIIITGIAGFIGYHLAKRCLEDKYEILGIDNINNYYDVNLKKARIKDLEAINKLINARFEFHHENIENFEKIGDMFRRFKPDCVIHLAGQAGVRYSIENPMAYISSNLVGFSNIIEISNHSKVNNFIYASSSSVYGGNENLPFLENEEVAHPVSLYAATKRSNELIAHTYSHLYGLPCTGLRFFTVYGPWGRPDMALFLFTKSILNREAIKIFNNGDMLRDFTYIDDIIESIMRLIKKPAEPDKEFDKKNPNPSTSWAPNRIFNIGNSNPTQLMEYITEIETYLNIESIKEFHPLQPGDVKSTSSDNTKLEKWIDFKPNTSIKDGVRKFIDWYLNFYNINIDVNS